MSVSAAHFKEVTNGYEKRSDGLWVHKGRADIGSARVVGTSALTTTPANPPTTGTGMELLYSQPAHTGYVQVYNRDTGVYGDLVLTGKNIQLAPQSGGTVQVPAGSIGTAAIAPNAVSQLIGSYFTTPTFTTTTLSTWLATPVTTGSIACSGAPCRIEASTAIYHSVVGAPFYSGLMVDGVLAYPMTLSYEYQANVPISLGWTVYYTPTAANHTFTLSVFNAAAGTLAMAPNVYSALYVTEQRR